MKTTNVVLLLGMLFFTTTSFKEDNFPLLFIEAESFPDQGGWVIDQQSIDQMGSPYLLAHGLGTPVEDARTSIEVPSNGKYRIWVRTRDWVAPWNSPGAPGKFQLVINGQIVNTTFGIEGADWHWQEGGVVKLKKGTATLSLHDLTGFEGRCDAIILSSDLHFQPPNDSITLSSFRKKHLQISDMPEDKGHYDFVVVGGGMAGICAAVSAARLGMKVALIQNRPVLGGNNSSEVRVGLSGLIYQKPYPNLGSLVDEIGPVGHWNHWEAQQDPNAERSKKIMEIISKNPEKRQHNAGPIENYADDKKLAIVKGEENIDLFLNTHVFKATTHNGRIQSVTGKDIKNSKEYLFRGTYFADCTGDGNLGFLAGADYRSGRESKAETGEIRAPEQPDKLVMGTSVQWNTRNLPNNTPFPATPWAVAFNENTCHKDTIGDWDWETGAYRDQVREIEYIRDYAFRVIYGNWDFIKNKSTDKEQFSNRELHWVAYIGGKRESRRLLGDIILTEQDILNQTPYEDGSFTTTWGIDLHYPVRTGGFTGEAFRSRADIKDIQPYQVPYRCLYSRNIENLFMAGRDISVTHVALGSIRVQRTTGMMGEVIGMAASICLQENSSPRGIYQEHFGKLQKLMEKGIGNPRW
ncbi:MAG: FAD-dependent oxidoreductase [Cyclobacteriaceae bacterium]|nr:FAD-dependent oxidoreductase [Cyclobacteriaceae bacterium]